MESKQEQWRRKALRRRPPTPPTTSSHAEATSSDLRQRILEILSTTSNEECDRQLSKLKRELESQQESPENIPNSEVKQTEVLSEDPSAPGSSRRRTHHRRRRQQDSESSANSNDNEDRRRRRAARRAERLRRMNSSPPSSNTTISNLVGSNSNGSATNTTHLATDHEDTTEGAVHCFQDEFGNWHSYTFSQTSAGVSSVD